MATLTVLVFLLIASSVSVESKLFTSPLEPEDHRFSNYGYTRETPFYGFKVVRLLPLSKEKLEAIYKMEDALNITIDFWTRPSSVQQPVDILTGPNDFLKIQKFLEDRKIRYKIINSDIDLDIRMENQKHSSYQFNQYTGFDYSRYHNYYEIVREMRSLVSQYSSIATLEYIGRTFKGKSQYAVKISVSNNPNRKLFFFNCGVHAREWITPATCMYMLNEMLTKYKTDRSVWNMLNRMDWVIMPVVNVDGYEYSWQSQFARMWRKTRTTRRGTSCIGADPNRNFDHHFGGVGTSSNPCSNTYKGPYAFSEPCINNLRIYLEKQRRNLIGYIDIHSYSQLWMTPWGYTKRYPDDYQELARVSKKAVDALRNVHGTQYRYGPSSIIIYPTSGASDDWAYGYLKVKYSFGLELRDKGNRGFLLPAVQIIPTGEETFAAFKAMAMELKF